MKSQLDFCIFECTDRFDQTTGLAELAKYFHIVSLKVSPTLFGWPIRRDRLYMLAVNYGSLQWRSNIRALGFQQAFEILFKRHMIARGDELARAPDDAIKGYIKKLALLRGFPATRPSGSSWACKQVLAPLVKANVKQIEETLARSF